MEITSCIPESALKKYSLLFEQELAKINNKKEKNMNEKTICPKCGAELDYTPDEGPFCEQCGAKLIDY
jgi:predicted amidophosphoribosyltransferase